MGGSYLVEIKEIKLAANAEVSSYGERISSIEATLEHMATKADINRLEGKIDSNLERISGQIKWLIVLVLLALAASAPDVIALLR